MQDVRTTSGQWMQIGYDPAANTLIFREEGWHADAFRLESTPMVTRLQRPIGRATITRLRDIRRRSHQHTAAL